uniref:Uncharacterized protein n=1 Tax=Caenorhabditis japonica TaxID=281687 RepID=A0A8R1IM13_CAEJA
MITELLNPSKDIHGRELVEEVDDEQEEEEVEAFFEESENLFVQKIVPEIEATNSTVKKFGYGFGWSKMGVIERLRDEIGKLVDLRNPEEVEIEVRAAECISADYEVFDEGRYL